MNGRFVVHEHQARQRHYDLRLEMDGVLKSWTLPKGPSMNPSVRRLAIRMPDHPLDCLDFEGVVPPGQYGAGPLVVWDRGTYSTVDGESADAQLRRGELLLELDGARLRGGFALVRFARGDGTDWLLVKRNDPCADATWQMTTALTPRRLRALVERRPPCGIE